MFTFKTSYKYFLAILFLLLTFRSFANNLFPVTAKHSMVVSTERLASQIGSDILQSGGNAIDAAVAVGYALAVVDPCCGNLGGGGMMVIHLADGRNIFLNFREKAPLKANKDMFLNTQNPDAPTLGYLAVAVPGTVLGLNTALEKYGRLSLKQVITPAIHLAQQGFEITPYFANQLSQFEETFKQQPNIAKIFLKDGHSLKPGDRLVQIDLAKTLKFIADKGSDAFYKGSIAQAIVNASQQNGGILSLSDFSQYNVQELTPIRCSYRGYTILSSPPPSSGGITLCEMLNILENFPIKYLGYHSAQSTRIVIEAMRYAFNDRNAKLGDPDFVKNPVNQFISKNYADKISQQMNCYRFTKPIPPFIQEPVHTTHYSIVDNQGNAVSVTYTLNGMFGAKVIAGNTGFFLNNEMDDFTTKPGSANEFGLVQSELNDIEPGKRPLSSMTPTMIMKDGHLVMVLGSPGGPRIITSVLLTILNVIDFGMNIQQAVSARRYHYQSIPDVVDIEPLALSFATIKKLEYLGYHFYPQNEWGAVEAIYIDSARNILCGANDDRHPDGEAVGK